MHTKPAFRTLVFLFLTSFSLPNLVGSEEKVFSKEEILALLPRGVDMDPADLSKAERLVSIGSSAHEVLGAELVRVDDWITASRIIAVFVKSSGDKSVARRYLARFLEISRNDDMWPSVRTQAVEAIRKFEEAQKVQSPIPKQSDPPVESESSPKQALGPKPAPTPNEEPASSTPWGSIVGGSTRPAVADAQEAQVMRPATSTAPTPGFVAPSSGNLGSVFKK